MKKKKEKSKRRYLPLVVMVLVTSLIAFILWTRSNEAHNIIALDEETYLRVKSLIVTPGTKLSTVKLVNDKGGTASGTLVRGSDFEVIITVLHSFSKSHSGQRYQYILDGRNYPLERVYSHPLPGPLGVRDISFCFAGKSKRIQGGADIPRDAGYDNISISPYPLIHATKLDGKVPVEISGILYTNIENPLYLIRYDGKDGESGSGVIGNKRFFVLKGNIAVGSEQISAALGMPPSKITLLTEL